MQNTVSLCAALVVFLPAPGAFAECANNQDCSGGTLCVDLECESIGPYESGCESNDECQAGKLCIDGLCLGEDVTCTNDTGKCTFGESDWSCTCENGEMYSSSEDGVSDGSGGTDGGVEETLYDQCVFILEVQCAAESPDTVTCENEFGQCSVSDTSFSCLCDGGAADGGGTGGGTGGSESMTQAEKEALCQSLLEDCDSEGGSEDGAGTAGVDDATDSFDGSEGETSDSDGSGSTDAGSSSDTGSGLDGEGSDGESGAGTDDGGDSADASDGQGDDGGSGDSGSASAGSTGGGTTTGQDDASDGIADNDSLTDDSTASSDCSARSPIGSSSNALGIWILLGFALLAPAARRRFMRGLSN